MRLPPLRSSPSSLSALSRFLSSPTAPCRALQLSSPGLPSPTAFSLSAFDSNLHAKFRFAHGQTQVSHPLSDHCAQGSRFFSPDTTPGVHSSESFPLQPPSASPLRSPHSLSATLRGLLGWRIRLGPEGPTATLLSFHRAVTDPLVLHLASFLPSCLVADITSSASLLLHRVCQLFHHIHISQIDN